MKKKIEAYFLLLFVSSFLFFQAEKSNAQIDERPLIIISDVDDTIKATNVIGFKLHLKLKGLNPFRYRRNKKNVLRNLAGSRNEFLGMGALYRDLVCGSNDESELCYKYPGFNNLKNTHLFYVSGVPNKLVGVSLAFLQNSLFPKGPIFDRPRGLTTVEHKTKSIKDIISSFPSGRFLLIGDNGEHDPKVYHDIVNEYSSSERSFETFIHYIANSNDQEESIKGALILKDQIPYLSASDLAWQFEQGGLISKKSFEEINEKVKIALTNKESSRKLIPKWLNCTGIILPKIELREELLKLCDDNY